MPSRRRAITSKKICLIFLSLALILGCERTKTERVFVPQCPTGLAWRSQHPYPLGSAYFLSVYALSNRSVYAVGQDGVIAHLGDNGWELMESGFYGFLRDVWAASDSDVFVVGDLGNRILRFDGSTWRLKESTGAGSSLRAIWGFSSSDVWALSYSGVVHYDGTGWTSSYADPNVPLYDIWGSAPDDIYVTSYRPFILHYDGTSWDTVETDPKTSSTAAIWGSGPNDVWASTWTDTVLHYDGASWTPMVHPDVSGGWSMSATETYLFGPYEIWRYDGSSFTDITDFDICRNIAGIGGSGGMLFCVGDNGIVATYDGSRWTDVQGGPFADLNDVWTDGPTNAWAVGEAGTILHYDGTSWSNARPHGFPSVQLNGVAGRWNNLYAVGDLGTVLRFNGYSLENLTDDGVTSSRLADVCVVENEAFAVGIWGTIVHIVGDTLRLMESPSESFLRGVWGSAPNDVFAVGDRGTILHYDGMQWIKQASPDTTRGIYAVWGTGPRDVYACGSGRTMLHYDGNTWSVMWITSYAWYTGIWGTSSHDIYAVASGTAIYHYDGSGWIGNVLPRVRSALYAVSGSAADNVFAVGERGAIVHYGP
jgi:hypothetical protein